MEITKRFRIFVTMTSQEYTQWLKGFLDAVDGYNITKKQFDTIREKLKEVNDNNFTFPGGGWGVPNTNPIMPLTSPNTIPYSPITWTTGGTTTATIPLSGTISTTNGGAVTLTNTADDKMILKD